MIQHATAGLWRNGATSSSNRQYFRARGRARSGADVNAKYGIDPGAVPYTFVFDQCEPFHAKVISATAGEAPHVLDSSLHHEHRTAFNIEEHYTPTAGAIDHVFGLCQFLGFRFAPRIKNLTERPVI
ncbi:MAG: Tn3 family transposase [Methylocella sp.]